MADRGSESSANYVLLTRLADEFAARYRAGERPPLQEYIDRHPGLADDIRELFPAMVEIEQVREDHHEAAEPDATPPAPALEQLGDFRILREVGKGGMGIVYEAEQVSLGRHVALKVLPRSMLLDSRAKRRFEREAKSAAKLHHTNIVPVFGVGEQDGLPYYVMQFIQGLGLDAVLDELKRLQLGHAKTGTVLACGLRLSRNVVPVANLPGEVRQGSNRPHGELTAAHVARSLLTGEFEPTTDGPSNDNAIEESPVATAEAASRTPATPPSLSDSFTVSSSSVVLPARGRDGGKSGHRKASYWQSVASIGVQVAEALEYAHKQGVLHRDIKPSNLLLDTQGTVWVADFGLAKADDQQNLTHTGDILGTLRYMPPEAFEGKAHARGDVYALGLTLYEMLAFRPAFDERERNRLIKQVTHAEPVRLGKLNRAVPRDLETIVHKAIDKDPKQRYASAEALAADLHRFLEDEPIHARRTSTTERLARWCRHNPLIAGLTAALAAVFLAGFAGVAWKWQDAERQKDLAQTAELEEAKQRTIAVEEADHSRHLLYAADMSLVGQAWEAGDIGRVRNLLERQQPQKDLHGFEWRYLRNLCRDGSRLTLRGHTTAVMHVVFSPDGQTLVTTSRDNTVRLWDLASRRHVKLLIGANSAAFSPDGKLLAIASGKEVLLWDVVAKRERARFPHPDWLSALTFSPDGKLLATSDWVHAIRIWNMATQQVDVLAGHTGAILCIAFSPDGKILASGASDTTVRLWDVAARRTVATCKGHLDLIWSLSFSPDGKTLASASVDSVRLWDAVTGRPLKTLRKNRTEVTVTAFSPDGKTVASGDTAGMIRIGYTQGKEGTALLRGHSAAILALTFSPDGRSLVSSSWDGTVKVWHVAPGSDANILTGHKAWLSSLALSADGKTLAVVVAADQENIVQLWDLASRRPSGSLLGHERALCCLEFAPGGQVLATGSYDKTVRLWDVANKKQLHQFQHTYYVFSVAFSPDGKFLAAGDPGGNALVWDLATRQKVAQLSQATRVRFSPDGKLLASAAGQSIRLWDVATWQSVATLEEGNPGTLPVRFFQGDIVALAFAPDGRTLAARDGGGVLQLRDVAGKRQIARSRGHPLAREVGSESSLAYSPDRRRLATGDGDGLVKLWDADSLLEVATLTGHDGPVYGLAFTPDGNTLATASADTTVRLWQAPPVPETLDRSADAPALVPLETFNFFVLELYDTAAATRSIEGTSQRVDVTAIDGTGWHAQLTKRFNDLQEGATYTIRFRAKADRPRPLPVVAIIAQPDWHNIGLREAVSLTENWREYHYTFVAKDLGATNMIQFHLGERTGTVWIADFTITKEAK
jgi:eukaryotic-like serine/threonine-protein kinase